jgi:quinol monooxygenase YgiN
MVNLRLTMTPLQGKTPEIIQTIAALAAHVRTHSGCLEFEYHSRDDSGAIEVVQQWSDQAAADSYLASREHRVLVGAAETLCREHSLLIK